MPTTLGHRASGLRHGAPYDEGMFELPASVRLALWVTHSWNGGPPLRSALARSFPDLDHVAGDLHRLDVWCDLGERALFVALPRAGDTTRMPPGSAAAEATDVGECVFVPALGGVLVPTLTEFGPPGDTGVRADWRAFEADPMPLHRLEMLDLRQVHRTLLGQLAAHADRFESVGGAPWGAEVRGDVEHGDGPTAWGVPDATPAGVVPVMGLAAGVSRVAHRTGALTALGSGGLSAATSAARAMLLRSLAADADDALTDAANIAVMTIAGWRPRR